MPMSFKVHSALAGSPGAMTCGHPPGAGRHTRRRSRELVCCASGDPPLTLWVPLHIHRLTCDANFVDGDVHRHRAAEQRSRAHVKAGEVQGTFDDVPLQLASGKRSPLMTTLVLEGVVGAIDVDQQHTFAGNCNPFHLAWLEVADRPNGDKVAHAGMLPLVSCPHVLAPSQR